MPLAISTSSWKYFTCFKIRNKYKFFTCDTCLFDIWFANLCSYSVGCLSIPHRVTVFAMECVWKSEDHCGCWPLPSSLFETESVSVCTLVYGSGKLACELLESLVSSSIMHYHIWLYLWVLMFAWQTLLPNETSPEPNLYIFLMVLFGVQRF